MKQFCTKSNPICPRFYLRRREVNLANQNSWEESYKAAVLEADWTKMDQRIQTAESAIHKRRLELSQDHGGTQEEREALVNAVHEALR